MVIHYETQCKLCLIAKTYQRYALKTTNQGVYHNKVWSCTEFARLLHKIRFIFLGQMNVLLWTLSISTLINLFQLHFGRCALKYEWIREQLNALDKLYFSIKSFQLNTCNEGFRGDCAFFHMGSRNKYSKHLAFQFRIFDITVDLDSTLLIKFKILGVSMYKSFLSPKFGLSHFGLDFFWIWLSVRIF